jgi:hypothetical protein
LRAWVHQASEHARITYCLAHARQQLHSHVSHAAERKFIWFVCVARRAMEFSSRVARKPSRCTIWHLELEKM